MPHPQIAADVAGFFDSKNGFGRDALLFQNATDPSPVSVVVIEVDSVEEFTDGLAPVDGTKRTVRIDGQVGGDFGNFLEIDGERFEVVNVDALHDGIPTLTLKRVP